MRRIAVVAALVVVLALAGCSGVLTQTDGAAEPPSDQALAFSNVAEDAGFEYASIETGIGNGNDGVYVADYDRDLREDLLVTGNNTEGPALFRNTGDGFERTDELPALEGRVQSALWFDYDGDGWEDLLLLRRGGTPVFLENDAGTLERTEVGLEDETFTNPVGASAADADGDGTLELFVIQYGDWSDSPPLGWQSPIVDDDNGNPNAYFDWDGEAFVRDEDAGIAPDDAGAHWSLAVTFQDVDGDGHPDVHVANDYYNDTFYRNRGDGTFERHTLGAATDRNGMSSTPIDLTGDGQIELFVTNIHVADEYVNRLSDERLQHFRRFTTQRLGKRMKGNNLLVHQGDGQFEDRGTEVGVHDGGWGWAATFADLDNDGERDLFQATQHAFTFDFETKPYETPMAWVQQDGQFYEQDALGIGLESHDGRSAVRVDYQVDGAQDVAIGTYEQSYRLYRNDAAQGESLQVVVDAGDGDHTAVGATVEATVDGETQRRVRSSLADYQSQDSRVLHFGLGDESAVEELRVTWPDGTERTFEDVEAGQRIRVTPDGIEDRIAYGDA